MRGATLDCLENLLNSLSGFLGFDYRFRLIERGEITGGGKITRLVTTNSADEILADVELPLMNISDDLLIRTPFGTFTSPLAVVPLWENGALKNTSGETIESDEGLDLLKASVAPMYVLYLASETIFSLIKGSPHCIPIKAARVFANPVFHRRWIPGRNGRHLSFSGVVLERYDPLNVLDAEYLRKRLIIPLDTERIRESWRLPNRTHIGVVDLFETPETDRIGASLVLVSEDAFDSENCSLKKVEKTLGTSTSQIPFLPHSDGARIEMGSKNMKQALKVEGAEEPLVRTTENVLDTGVNALVVYSLFYGYTFEDGIVVSESFARRMKANVFVRFKIPIIAPLVGEKEEIETEDRYELGFHWSAAKPKPDSISSIETTVRVKKGVVKKGEDAIEVLLRVSVGDGRSKILKAASPLSEEYVTHVKNVRVIDIRKHQKSLRRNLSVSSYLNSLVLEISAEVEKPLSVGDKLTGRHGNKGVVSLILPDSEMPKVKIGKERLPAEVIISPLSVVSRMNLSQLYETHVSTLIRFGILKKNTFDPLQRIDEKTRSEILNSLRELGADEYGRFEVSFERPRWIGEKEKINIRAVAGWQYILRLDHSSPDKFHAVGEMDKDALREIVERETKTGAKVSSITFEEFVNLLKPSILFKSRTSFNPVTLQPRKGKRRGGGQKLGEMEMWTLLDHGAHGILRLFEERNMKGFKEIVSCTCVDFVDYTLGKLIEKLKGSSKISKGVSKFDMPGLSDLVKNLFGKENCQPFVSWDDTVELIRKRFHALFRSGKSVEEVLKEVLRDLSSKEGYIREFCIKRRLYNSARMVIVPEPWIDVDEVILPERLKDVWEVKEGDLVLVNRQPSLHRHSIQAFRVAGFTKDPVLRFPILVCKGYNADFDGDTVAVYYSPHWNTDPTLKKEVEGMLPSRVPFLQGSGDIAWSVDQDVVCGMKVSKGEAVKRAKDAIQSGRTRELLEEIKSSLIRATEEGLTLSVYEIKERAGSFEKIVSWKCRGSQKQWKQLTDAVDGMHASFIEGLDTKDFLEKLPVRARRSLMDKKLHVADAGYFTRRLVELLGDLKVSRDGEEGILTYTPEEIETLKEWNLLENALLGRVRTDGIVLKETDLEELKKNPSRVSIFSPLHGDITYRSLGIDPATLSAEWRSEYIGVLAAHTIGERGTQLSMQTFHTGGSGVPFRMSKVESFIMDAAKESMVGDVERSFKEFLRRLVITEDAKEIREMLAIKDGRPHLIEAFFNARFVYFEILFRKLYELFRDGRSLKGFLMDWKERGVLTVLSFESGHDLLLKLMKGEIGEAPAETHPRVKLFFGGDL